MAVIKVKPPKLAQYQKDFMFCDARFTIVDASTKVGKTHAMIIWLYGETHALGEDALNKSTWWLSPTYSQSKIAYKRLKRNLLSTALYKFNDTELKVLFPNGAEMHFKTAEKVDNLYGENVYAAVLDEAPRMRYDVWPAVRSTLTATKAPCKIIGNYGGISNWVTKLAAKASNDPMYAYYRITCWDGIEAGILDEDEVLQAQKDLPVKVFEELYEAKASDAEGQLIRTDSLKKLFISRTSSDSDTTYLTCDPARLGKDKTVIMVWKGLSVVEIKSYDVSKATLVINEISALQQKYNVRLSNIIIDENGLGGPIIDMLNCQGFLNNGKAIRIGGSKLEYANLKSQCYFKLAEYVNDNKLSIECGFKEELSITEELEWVRLPKLIDTSKLSVMSKDDIKKWLGRSPDYSDTLMMRMWYEIKAPGIYNIR